jgi:hypothetical protein
MVAPLKLFLKQAQNDFNYIIFCVRHKPIVWVIKNMPSNYEKCKYFPLKIHAGYPAKYAILLSIA